jgi:hypothetical protein
VTVFPEPAAFAVTVYRCDTFSAQVLCHTVPAAFIVPLTGSPAVVTVTLLSLPCAAVTVMPWPGWALVLPLAGVMDTWVPAGAELAAWWPPPPEAELLPPPPVQAAVTRPSAPQIAAAAIHRRLRAGEEPVAPTSEPPGKDP